MSDKVLCEWKSSLFDHIQKCRLVTHDGIEYEVEYTNEYHPGYWFPLKDSIRNADIVLVIMCKFAYLAERVKVLESQIEFYQKENGEQGTRLLYLEEAINSHLTKGCSSCSDTVVRWTPMYDEDRCPTCKDSEYVSATDYARLAERVGQLTRLPRNILEQHLGRVAHTPLFERQHFVRQPALGLAELRRLRLLALLPCRRLSLLPLLS